MKKYYRDESHPWLRNLKFTDVSVDELFRRARPQKEVSDKPVAWVIDLDSTLFCVGPRIKNIFLEFLRHHPNPRPEWHRVLPALVPAIQRYDIELTFREIFAAWDHARAGEQAADLWREFQEFWHAHFFSSRHMHLDDAYSGSSEFLHGLIAEEFEVVYLTARDRGRTAQGTYDAMRLRGFPLNEHTHVVMKPLKEEPDLSFKRKAAGVLRSRFEVAVFIDNEPENLVMAAQEFPNSEIVLFHTVMSDRVPVEDFGRALGGRSPLRLLGYERS